MNTTTAIAQPTPSVRKYSRFFTINRGFVVLSLGLIAGGWWMWTGFVFITLRALLLQSKEDVSVDEYDHPWLLNMSLFLGLPVTLWLLFCFAWVLGSPGTDLFSFGQFVHTTFSYDALAARDAANAWHVLGATLSVGLALGASIIISHELTHRTQDYWAMLVGRWLLAAPADATFSVEHVYGHHVYVGTRKDPATARRGESIYAFVVRSIVAGNISGWRIERDRLRKLRYGTFTWRNRIIRGYLMTAMYAAFFYYAAGAPGVALYFCAALFGKTTLERINYVEHYGLVRVPGEPVMPRHSWNSNHGSAAMLNLSRHSHHHHDASVPYQRLQPMKDQPEMPLGYMKMSFLCLVPSLWHRLMVPRLKEWDQRYATPQERELARVANMKSGIPALVELARTQPV